MRGRLAMGPHLDAAATSVSGLLPIHEVMEGRGGRGAELYKDNDCEGENGCAANDTKWPGYTAHRSGLLGDSNARYR